MPAQSSTMIPLRSIIVLRKWSRRRWLAAAESTFYKPGSWLDSV
ncbi:hypothetical protein [Paenibacillus polymyxa]|nr:hypothetical protein [Paenibacillus polymyxa]